VSAIAVLGTLAVLGPGRSRPPKAAAPPVVVSDGRAFGPDPYRVVVDLGREMHLSAIRARFRSPTSGVPTRYAWEVRRCEGATFEPIADASEYADAPPIALPRRRTWFVDAVGCAVRLTVLGTNGGVPAIESIEPIEGARDVLRSAVAFDDSNE
jgi:hypothetical protein